MNGHIIRFFTKAEFSHCGIVWKVPELPDRLFISEASTNLAKLSDVESGNTKRGVELLDFRSKMNCGYYDKVAVRKLKWDRTPEFLDHLEKFRRELRNVGYEKNLIEFIKSSFYDAGLKGNQSIDLSSLFCSEYVAESFIRCGLLPNRPLSNNYVPADFDTATVKGRLTNGALEDKIYIKLEDKK